MSSYEKDFPSSRGPNPGKTSSRWVSLRKTVNSLKIGHSVLTGRGWGLTKK